MENKIFILVLNVDTMYSGGATISEIVAISPDKAKLENMMRPLVDDLNASDEDCDEGEDRYYSIDEHTVV